MSEFLSSAATAGLQPGFLRNGNRSASVQNGFSVAEVRAELKRVLAFADFAASQHLTNFLRFVVDESLAGRAHPSKNGPLPCEQLDAMRTSIRAWTASSVLWRETASNARTVLRNAGCLKPAVDRCSAGKLRAGISTKRFAAGGGAIRTRDAERSLSAPQFCHRRVSKSRRHPLFVANVGRRRTAFRGPGGGRHHSRPQPDQLAGSRRLCGTIAGCHSPTIPRRVGGRVWRFYFGGNGLPDRRLLLRVGPTDRRPQRRGGLGGTFRRAAQRGTVEIARKHRRPDRDPRR